MDLDELRRDRLNAKKSEGNGVAIAKIEVKKVAVSKDDLITLPDGTTIVRDRGHNQSKERKSVWDD